VPTHTLVPVKPFRSWLVQRLVGILLLLGAVIAGSFLVTYYTLSSRDDIITAIADAGRLRQMTQSLVLLAERIDAIAPEEVEDYPGRTEDWNRFQLMAFDYNTILGRLSTPDGPYANLMDGPLMRVLESPPVRARAHLEAFSRSVGDFMTTVHDSRRAARAAALGRLKALGLGDALDAGTAVASMLERVGVDHVTRLKRMQIAALASLFALLALGGALLIRPLLRKVEHAETAIARLRFVVEGAREGVLITDPSGTILWANQAMTRISGYGFQELVGAHPGRLLQGPETDADVVNDIRIALAAERPIVRELLNYSKTGRPYWVRMSIVPRRDSRGELAEFVAIETDVTEARESKERERAALQTLVDAVSSLSEGFTYFDAEDRLRIWNQQFAAMLPRGGRYLREGMTFEQMLDESLAHGDPNDPLEDPRSFRQIRLAHHRSPGEPFEQKVQNNRYFLVNERRTKDGGTVAIYADISAIRRVELAEARARAEAEQTARTRAEFLAVMSHEIRTPLNGVLGMLDLALDGPLSPEQRQRLKTAFASAESLVGLIEDVLDFSRMEAGKLDLHLAPFSPHVLAADVASLIGPKLKHRPVEFDVQIDRSVPGGLNGDSGRIRQILINLLDNAAKFTEQGRIGLALRWQAENSTLIATVEDTGIGIPLHRLSEVFLDFRQIDPARTRRVGGAGLGLAITKRLVEAMNGSIRVESQPGKGSCFTVELALAQCRMDAVKESGAGSGSTAGTLAGLTILLAEDSPTNRMVAEAMLTRAGARVEQADDGKAALRMTQQRAYDAICMDVAMPGIDGLETTRWIREMDGPNAHTPIIAVTAHAMPGDRDRYQAAGMNGYVPKPLKSGSLEREILRVLEQRPAPRTGAAAATTPVPAASPVAGADGVQPGPETLQPTGPVIDPETLDMLAAAVPPEALSRMIQAFLQEMGERLDACATAVESRDWVRAARECHTLKSAAANLGALAFSRKAQELERTAKDQNPHATRQVLAELRELATQTSEGLAHRLHRLAADAPAPDDTERA